MLGTADVEDHEIVTLELTFARAAPLFPFLTPSEAWRPFFKGDRVELALDAESWLPRHISVFPAASDERRAWELRFGRVAEDPSVAILEVEATSSTTEAPDASLFEIPGSSAPALSVTELADRIGYRPATPTFTGDLELAAAIAPSPGPRAPRSVLVYTDGLDYVRIGERPAGAAPGTFGSLGPRSAQIVLPGGGVAYVRPGRRPTRAAPRDPRRRHEPLPRVQPADARARRDRGLDPDAGRRTRMSRSVRPAVAAIAGHRARGRRHDLDAGRRGRARPTRARTPVDGSGRPPPATFLAWVPKGLPAGFAEAVRALPETGPVTTVAEDHAWLTRSWDADGRLVDRTSAPYRIPLDTIAVDPASFAVFLDLADRRVDGGLHDGPAGVLSATSATLRGLGPGASLRFPGGHTCDASKRCCPIDRWVAPS